MSTGQDDILVVGDWFVDEHWVVARDRSPTASRRGQSHLHVLQNPRSDTEMLAGAGLDASFLSSVFKDRRVYGIGAWDLNDKPYLKSMLAPGDPLGRNQHSERRPRAGRARGPGNVTLFNLSEFFPGHGSKFGLMSTTRLIRLYFRDAGQIDLTHRIDWEELPTLERATGQRCWVDRDCGTPAWADVLRGWKPKVIVVRDHMKGVISSTIIDELIRYCHGTHPRWYLYSKAWHLDQVRRDKDEWYLRDSSWLTCLAKKHQDIRLVFVPFAAAQNAMLEPHRHVHNWWLRCDRPSWRAMKLMDALHGLRLRARKRSPRRNYPIVCVLPNHSHAVARLPHTSGAQLSISCTGKADLPATGVPFGSALFAAIVASMESNSESPIEHSISVADKWAAKELGRIREEHWHASTIRGIWKRVSAAEVSASCARTKRSWFELKDDWASARRLPGWIEYRAPHDTDRKGHLDLWRAMTDVDGYICLAREKRETLREIKRQVSRFQELSEAEPPGKNVSIMLRAGPGSGKSALLEKLAREVRMELLSFNISQMVAPSEILDCFDSIVSRQSGPDSSRRSRGGSSQPVLAFFDEINTTVAAEYVYGKFLDPIDRGTYVRGGKTFYIRPCVWVFAGTETPEQATKFSDFWSRLTIPPLPFGMSGDDRSDNALLERRYIAADLLQRAFKEVDAVSEAVLAVFELLYDSSPRECDKFARQFRSIEKGEVRACNVPIEWIESSWTRALSERRREVKARRSTLAALIQRWGQKFADFRRGLSKQSKVPPYTAQWRGLSRWWRRYMIPSDEIVLDIERNAPDLLAPERPRA